MEAVAEGNGVDGNQDLESLKTPLYDDAHRRIVNTAGCALIATPRPVCVGEICKSAHLLASPRQPHTGVLAKSLISIFYEGTRRQAPDYQHAQMLLAYCINYSVNK